jgi:hypothetical protein
MGWGTTTTSIGDVMNELSAEEQRFVDTAVEVIYYTGLVATCVAILWWFIGKVTK